MHGPLLALPFVVAYYQFSLMEDEPNSKFVLI